MWNSWTQKIVTAGMTALVVAMSTVIWMAATPEAVSAESRRPGRFADGGIYVGGTMWGGSLNHMRVSMGDDINARLAAARSAGCLNVVQLSGDGNWRGDSTKLAAELADWLKRTHMAAVDILMLGEEHPYDAGSHLDPLYDVVKKHCDVPVYVWPSAPLGPLGKADGYGYDNYGAPYTVFRQNLQRFLSTGKPAVYCIDGSGCSDIVSAREQVMVCREFDVPAFYFIADSGVGGASGWLFGGAVYAPWRNFVFSALEFQRRNAGPSPLEAGDMVWGEPINLAADYEGRIDCSWSGIGQATVFGFKRLRINAEGVRPLDQRTASLDYQFWSPLPVEKAQWVLSLTPSGEKPSKPIKVEHSRCGMLGEWRTLDIASETDERVVYDLSNPGREFRLRMTLPNQSSPAIRSCRLTGRVAIPEDRVTDLDMYVDGWRGGVRYVQDLNAGLWKTMGIVGSPQALEPDGLALRGKVGGASANVVQKFSSSKPLGKVVVRLTGQCNGRNLGGSFSLGVSLDGQNVIAQGMRGGEPTAADGTYRGTFTADLSDIPEFKGVKAFYVHMGQVNSSGLTARASSRLESLEIDAARDP